MTSDNILKNAESAIHAALAKEHFGESRIHPAYMEPDSDMAHQARRMAPSVIAAIAGDIRAQALRDFDTDLFARTMGGDLPWMTTATKVAGLFRKWLDTAAEEVAR